MALESQVVDLEVDSCGDDNQGSGVSNNHCHVHAQGKRRVSFGVAIGSVVLLTVFCALFVPSRDSTLVRRLAETDRSAITAPLDPGNPFARSIFYVNPSYRNSLDASIASSHGQVKETLQSMRDVPSAYWLDHKGKIRGRNNTNTMEGILADAASKSPPELVVFIVYDLPNRDCHAKASNGEICCTYKADRKSCDYAAGGTCAEGLGEYQRSYIDPIASVLREYSGRVPTVLVIEPDSLPNLATNTGDLRCGNAATQSAYQNGIAYAVKTLKSAAPSVSIYLDAGHGGWLGWENNLNQFVKTIKSLGVAEHLRGFATNVAGYQALGLMCPEYDWCLNNRHPTDPCCRDPCGLSQQWNPSHNELNYALNLRKHMAEGIEGFEPHIIVDTGRNGVDNMRDDCANWCNVRGAGVGHVPTAHTTNTAILDAYFWLKTPGESDGCTEMVPDGSRCPRFDTDCGSRDSLGSRAGEPRAPEAGQWFDYQIKELALNAALLQRTRPERACPSTSLSMTNTENAAGTPVYAELAMSDNECVSVGVAIKTLKFCGPGELTLSRMTCDKHHDYKAFTHSHPSSGWTKEQCEDISLAGTNVEGWLGSYTLDC